MNQFLLFPVTLTITLTVVFSGAAKEDHVQIDVQTDVQTNFQTDFQTDVQTGKQVKNLQFSWNDCTPKTEGRNQGAAVIKSLEVSPDPIIIPGNVSIGFELDSNANLTSPSPVSVSRGCFLFVE